ncbi:MAG TPA: protein TolQ, partial [Halieaceae bacterium]|nr:protein TolQ [Halieaceae bacterium]
MNEELSVIGLILGASLTVKLVMATLVAASVTSWFMIVQRVIILQRANAELVAFEDRFWSGMDLAQLYRDGSDAIDAGTDITGGEALFRAGFKEFS